MPCGRGVPSQTTADYSKIIVELPYNPCEMIRSRAAALRQRFWSACLLLSAGTITVRRSICRSSSRPSHLHLARLAAGALAVGPARRMVRTGPVRAAARLSRRPHDLHRAAHDRRSAPFVVLIVCAFLAMTCAVWLPRREEAVLPLPAITRGDVLALTTLRSPAPCSSAGVRERRPPDRRRGSPIAPTSTPICSRT